jgi:outer membrane protein OmpA-like peptidoglycan-associated protein
MRVRTVLLVFACLFLATLARAQDRDVEGSKDHPMVSRFPGYYIDEYDAQDFSAYEFATGAEDKRVEGRYWKISYMLKEGAKKGGPIEIARNYASTFTQRGGKKLLEEMDAAGGRLIARMPAGDKNIWLEVAVHDAGVTYILTIVEEAALVQQVEFTATDLAKQLAEKGSVALHGILFDTGKATIKPESKTALAPIGELLAQDQALKLEIQGHTDNVGAAAANLKLSQDRAAAVKAYLVATFSIPQERLTSAGFGDTKPVADNKTDAGRAQNRRVELVKK